MITPEDIQKFKKKLEEEQVILINQLSGVKNHKKADMGDDVDHLEEEEDETEEISIEIGLEVDTKERLENIKMALFKIEKGDFGFCEKCGVEIEKEILEIDPESRWCKNCKKESK